MCMGGLESLLVERTRLRRWLVLAWGLVVGLLIGWGVHIWLCHCER